MSTSAPERLTQLAFLEPDSSEIVLPSAEVEKSGYNFPESCIGASVDLGRRAVWLLRALDEYSKASQLKPLPARWEYDTRLRNRYTAKDIRDMTATIASKEAEGSSFFRLSGNMRILTETDATEEEVSKEIDEANQEFVDTYIGPANEKAREAYRRKLRRHQKMAKNR